MKKVLIRRPGGIERLEIVFFEPPQPKENEVLIETVAAGVNYADLCVRWGVYESAKTYVGWPITPGFEFAGRVLKVGASVDKFKEGDAVFGVTRFSGYSSHIIADSELLWHKPLSMTFEEAAAFPAVFLTAYHGLLQSVYVRPGMKVLIHSAGGGVGSALVQLCKIQGLEVTGVVGASHKTEYVRNLGADFVIDKSTQDLWERAEQIAPQGFDLVFGANGPETIAQSFKHLRPTGKLVVYGFHTLLPKEGGRIRYLKALLGLWKMPRFNPLNMTTVNKSVIAFNLSFLFDRKELLNEAMPRLLHWLETNQLRPPKIQSYAFEQVGSAHTALQSGRTTGKLVLKFIP